jgi:hypothetical protein
MEHTTTGTGMSTWTNDTSQQQQERHLLSTRKKRKKTPVLEKEGDLL